MKEEEFTVGCRVAEEKYGELECGNRKSYRGKKEIHGFAFTG